MLLWIVVATLTGRVSGNLFTGVESMKRLSAWENEHVTYIEQYIAQQEEKIKLLKM